MRSLLALLVIVPVGAMAGAYEDGLRFLKHKSYDRAAAAFQMAAAQGEAGAERQLAFMYYRGHGFKQSDSNAVVWFERAANHGDVESQVNLGKMYENGLSVARDNAKSAHWFRLAAERGHRGSQLRLGEICYLGDGVPRDRAEAVKWWQLATAPDDDLSRRFREMLRSAISKITPDEVEEGGRRAMEWKPVGKDER